MFLASKWQTCRQTSQRAYSQAIAGFSALGKSMLWLGSAQFSGRLVRVVSSILLARIFTPEIFGQVAIIVTSFELICTLTRRITSVTLIRMNDEDFAKHLSSANWVNIIVCVFALLLMVIVGFGLVYYYQMPSLLWPMIVMSASFLLLPLGMNYATLNLRNNKMRIVGRANLWQTIADGVLTALLAIAGMGIWAVIIPKVLVIFVWIAVHRYQNPLPSHGSAKRECQTGYLSAKFNTAKSQCTMLLRTGVPVVLSDVVIALRQHIDYLLIGYFLGLEALGVYFFVYNISLGISLGLVNSFGTAFYSYICSHSKSKLQALKSENTQDCQRRKFINSSFAIMAVTSVIIISQTALAPWYVPFIYGDKWLATDALSLFTFLCLSGLTRPLAEAASQLLLANNLGKLNLKINLFLTATLAAAIIVGAQISTLAVAQAVMLCCLTLMPAVFYFSYNKVFRTNAHLSIGESL
ncbi:oligosaccharide flippase family protein [Shewanella sp. WXL01]|uniref:oligosaccharide flippase family protein n=1 Tax=Shewanella sp. WXL01 TaxID=2709721 RepID=UPI001438537B|nr:oligosaccharide flippase family protein [Shewanella sp. WXL01]NKF51714.1 oligosaccharide flippase family protein [Shewanella sp. WXL01]